MSQKKNWEKEYEAQKLMTGGSEPQADVLRFLKAYKKSVRETGRIGSSRVLDLGCGMGRNANYLASLGAEVIAIEFANNAVREAARRAKVMGVEVKYIEQSIGEKWPVESGSINLVLDITSSNSLNETERAVYLTEAARVLKPGGTFFVRALCKDGDKNAKFLLKENPGREHDTYILKGVGIEERVFTEQDFIDLYGQYFEIVSLEKRSGYQRWDNQSYKRNYWLAYLLKK